MDVKFSKHNSLIRLNLLDILNFKEIIIQLIQRMSENMDNEKKRAWRKDVIIAIIIIVVVIVGILTFMWFSKRGKECQETLVEKKRQRLDEVNKQIENLEAKKGKIAKWEKNIKLSVRIGVGIVFILANLQFYHSCISNFTVEKDLSKFLNVIAAIVALYSFVAFISYGSVENFVNKLKEVLKYQLHKYHLYSIEELEALYNERDQLNKDLEDIEGPSNLGD